MQEITLPTMAAMISYVGVEMGEPTMFWAQPGVGKTDVVGQVCGKHSGVLCDVRLGQYDSVDLRGIPVPDKELGQTIWYAPVTLPFKGNPRFVDDKAHPIFLFLDEFNQCQPPVFGVAMQLINERCIGEHELMDNVVIVCCGNREGDRGVVNRMPTTISNRLTHAEIVLDVDAWCYWAQEQGLPLEAVAFFQFRKPMLSTFDPQRGDKAFATPRSWVKALRYYRSAMPDDVKQAAMAGAVGQGPSAEFWGFVDVYHKITPISAIIKDPLKVKMPDQANMMYATAVAVSGSMDKTNIAPLHQYLERMDPEFLILAWQLAIRREKLLATTDEFIDVSKKHRAIFASS